MPELILSLATNPVGIDSFHEEGKTLREILKKVINKYPALENYILDTNDQLHAYLQVFCQDEKLSDNQMDYSINPSDEIFIFCPIRGG